MIFCLNIYSWECSGTQKWLLFLVTYNKHRDINEWCGIIERLVYLRIFGWLVGVYVCFSKNKKKIYLNLHLDKNVEKGGLFWVKCSRNEFIFQIFTKMTTLMLNQPALRDFNFLFFDSYAKCVVPAYDCLLSCNIEKREEKTYMLLSWANTFRSEKWVVCLSVCARPPFCLQCN